MEKKRGIINFVILTLLLSALIIPLVNAALTPQQEEQIINVLDSWPIKIVAGDPAGSFNAFLGAPLGKTGAIIIHIMIWLILFVAFSDIFGTFLPLTNKYVPWAIGFGMAVIVANFGIIPAIIAWMAAITATLGAASVFVAMLIAFGGFVVVTFFGARLKTQILKSKISITAKVGAAKTAAGIQGFAEGYKAFKKAARK